MSENNSNHAISFLVVLSMLFVSALPLEAGLGRIWPFASKKHVQQQIDPINGRVMELEEIGRKHESQIKDVDDRAQSAVKAVSDKLEETNRKTMEADRRAEDASTQAMQAQSHLQEVETGFDKRIENVDNYQPVRKFTLHFRINQSKLDKPSEESLDALAAELKDSKGYLLEIQGYTDPSGPPALNLELSQQRAESVVRYLSEKHEVPLFRMRTLGMGVVPGKIAAEGPKGSRRVEIQLLRNEAVDVASK